MPQNPPIAPWGSSPSRIDQPTSGLVMKPESRCEIMWISTKRTGWHVSNKIFFVCFFCQYFVIAVVCLVASMEVQVYPTSTPEPRWLLVVELDDGWGMMTQRAVRCGVWQQRKKWWEEVEMKLNGRGCYYGDVWYMGMSHFLGGTRILR